MPFALVLIAAVSAAAQHKPFFQRGVNFTAESRNYASPDALKLLADLRRYSVDAVALVPYGFTRPGEPSVRFGGNRVWERDDAIQRLADEAHRLKMKVLLKPQIWTGRGFPGDLDFPNPDERARWFAEYALFVEHYAKLATRIKADLFCVGVEFAKLSRHEAEWRKLIRRAREHYKGPLTYAAVQGPEFETLKFWDALDYIGLNNYYPLPDSLDVSAVVRKVEAVQKRFRKPVIFPEAGFSSFEAPHREPWDETARRVPLPDQARAYEAVFRAFYNKPWFYGMYWWKVGSDGGGGASDGSHTPWRKPAMDVVGKWYSSTRRAPAAHP